VAPCSLVYAYGRFRQTCCLNFLRRDGLSTVISSIVLYRVSMRKENHIDFVLIFHTFRGIYKPTCRKTEISLKRGPEYNDLQDTCRNHTRASRLNFYTTIIQAQRRYLTPSQRRFGDPLFVRVSTKHSLSSPFAFFFFAIYRLYYSYMVLFMDISLQTSLKKGGWRGVESS